MDELERQMLVGLIHQQSTEMAHIVEDLLVATRLDDGELTLMRLPVQMTREIESVLAALPAPAESTLVVLVSDSIHVVGDSSRIRQILRNLITNAYRYGGTSIVVEADNFKGMTVVSITDDGPSLPLEGMGLGVRTVLPITQPSGPSRFGRHRAYRLPQARQGNGRRPRV